MAENYGICEQVTDFAMDHTALFEDTLVMTGSSSTSDCIEAAGVTWGMANTSSMWGETSVFHNSHSVSMCKISDFFFAKALKNCLQYVFQCFSMFLADRFKSAMPWEHRSQSHLSISGKQVSASKSLRAIVVWTSTTQRWRRSAEIVRLSCQTRTLPGAVPLLLVDLFESQL